MTWRRIKEMPPEEVFSRILFGVLLIAAFFIPNGRWIALVMGILFIISALSGVCLTCHLYRVLFGKPKT
jgi:hypothetical protein